MSPAGSVDVERNPRKCLVKPEEKKAHIRTEIQSLVWFDSQFRQTCTMNKILSQKQITESCPQVSSVSKHNDGQ